jgi:Flp pilus assembly protein TadD
MTVIKHTQPSSPFRCISPKLRIGQGWSSFLHRVAVVMLAAVWTTTVAVAADVPGNTQESARLNNVGVAYMNQGFNEKALQKFEEAARLSPTSAIPLVNEGIAYLYLRKLPEAEETLKKAATLEPGNVRAWYSLGITHFSSGSQELALADLLRALALQPNDPDVHYFLGTIYVSQKKYAEAIAEFQAAIQIAPLHASAQFGLARALQREGKLDESRVHLKRFQEITESKIGTLMSASYGEQGRYATAQDMLDTPVAAGGMIPVTFTPAGLSSASPGISNPVTENGGGACIFDLEGNGSKDVVVMTQGQGLRAYRISKNGSLDTLPNQQTGLAMTGDGVACAVGDYDNDGLPDLAVALTDRIVLFHNLGHGKFADVTSAVGILPLNRPAGLTFVDFDHDGDLDLLVTGESASAGGEPNLLWRNNGNSTFTAWSKPTGLGGSRRTTGAVLSDINNDRAVDLVVTAEQGSPQIYENQREGPFKQVAMYADANLPATRALAVSDFNKDGWMDIAVTHAGAPGLSVWRNVEGKRFERIPVVMAGVTAAWGVTPIDFDNDGWIDLAVVVETAQGTELRVLRNLGPAGFVDVSEALGLRKLDLKGARSVISADIDGDGASDLLVTRRNAEPVILRNVGGSRNHALRIDLAGLADNKSAIGTKVEVFSGGDWQKFEVAGSSGYMGQGSTEIIAGLGQSDRADVVRLLWPTGVPQDELDLVASKPAVLTELDRRGSSCPVLFAWDGSKYKFITDVIGAAVIGHWVSPTSRNQSDTDEWVKIDGESLRSRNGSLSVRFGEPMEEINYIDQLRLVAVDHPAGTEVYTDERFLNEPPFASGKTIVASPQTHRLAGAWDDQGRDVLTTLSSLDKKYVHDFTNLTYAGFANMHTLTLDLGDWSANKPLRLFARGYVEYFSASSMYAAWQAGIAPHAPSIEVQLSDGSWKPVIDDAGFPAGLPRTIVIDLSGKLPENSRRIRIKTNLQIYWDQILVDNSPDSGRLVHKTELPLSSAHLAFRGYPQQIDGKSPGDLTYDYQNISATGPFQWQRGSYTRYGDVTPLLTTRDNHYVIFGSGEDVDAEFNDAALPALPPDWKRDYFFYADGFVKDMDFYEALPFTVAQMPFHGMTRYPYSRREHFPQDADSLAYQLDWNDRVESGDRTQRFQFNYQPSLSTPFVPAGNDDPQALGGTR